MEAISRVDVRQTKIILPRRPAHLLTRERLMSQLYDLLDYHLFILTAPAGYGKTSILVDWANQAELPICWYSLDALDREPHRFFLYFINALSKRFPAFGQVSQLALQSMTKNLDVPRLVHIMTNDVFDHIQEHFALILDDYHLLNNNVEIDTFISSFVQQVDENCHLVLASRKLPSLPEMPLMVARSQAGGLGFEELAFQAEEIQALALQNYHFIMPQSEAEILASETEGWITGVLLSTQPAGQFVPVRLQGIRSTGNELNDYLAQQILDNQPQILRDFLLRTSVLEEFDIALCQAVLGSDTDWQTLMQTVRRSNLFVLSVGTEGNWLRYHHLFLQFLQTRMVQEKPSEYEMILRRLAAVYTERESWEKAYAIYQRLGDMEATALFLNDAGEPMVKQGRIMLLKQWLEALPHDKLTSHPALLSRHGLASVMAGQTELGLQRLSRAADALQQSGDFVHLVGCLVWRATANRFLGDYAAAGSDVDQALSLYEQYGGRPELRAGAMRIKGLTLYWQGNLSTAIDWLKRSLAAFRELPNKQDEALLLMELGLATMSTGAYTQALKYYTQALPYWQQGFDPVRQAALLNNVGVLYHLMGQYERAASTLEQAMTTAHECGYARMEAMAYTSLGDLYMDLDAFEAAQEAYMKVKPLANQMGDRYLLFYVNVAQATLAEIHLSLAQAKMYLDKAWELVQGSNSDSEYGLWYLTAGRIAMQDEDMPHAITQLTEAAVRFERGGQQAENAKAHLLLGIIAASQNLKTDAESHLARAFFLDSEVESQNLLVLTGYRLKKSIQNVTVSPNIDAQIAILLNRISEWEEELPAMRRRLRRRSTAINFAPPHLTIQALGNPRVFLDSAEVNNTQWESLAARDMLFCLLAHEEGLTGEGLGVLFWPDKEPPKLKLHLKKTLYRIRRALQQNVVTFQQNRYSFNYSLDYEYDVEVFWQNIAKAQEATQVNNRVEAYRKAVECYQGPYLLGIDTDWVITAREKLWQTFRWAALFLAGHYLNTLALDTALSYCLNILDYDPCVEEAHVIAMRIYDLQGHSVKVASQYERCRQSLHIELGVQPSSQTQMLYRQLTQTSNVSKYSPNK